MTGRRKLRPRSPPAHKGSKDPIHTVARGFLADFGLAIGFSSVADWEKAVPPLSFSLCLEYQGRKRWDFTRRGVSILGKSS
ncbi:hypothetical protein MPNT_40036 [Candidatus Methylacidithermus pantelleriae]|uniref:Uncharacterized protein n=1 Tax=Candidatus Methylacidithermus pantelleriae TaxID=2744239 RepID=A0A8J2FWR5_9BACT|nr:hypothetical protein MPNT_40036 [Candidatus Methylacidithermus pantelleriae]